MKTWTVRRLDTGTAVRISVRQHVIQSLLPLDLPADELEQLPWAAPGLFDLQLNGYRGIWFSSESLTADDVETVITDFARQGIAGCLPTLITNSREAIEHGLSVIRAARERSPLVRAMVPGCHVEGPWISPENGPEGAHPAGQVRAAEWVELQHWQQAAGGLVRLVTLAPEAPEPSTSCRDSPPAVSRQRLDIRPLLQALIHQAIDRGATLGTHLGNGCAGMVPRHDNVFWPQLADDRLSCSIIADGWHLPADMLSCILRCKSLERLVLTCDVSGFGGCSPGRYHTPAVDVEVLPDGRIVVAGQTQFLAGSGATTGQCVAHFHAVTQLPPADIWKLASTNPRRLLKLPEVTLQEGSEATLTMFRLPTIDGQPQWQPVEP
ncbi:MAG UNVERIFIED_CONTAM: amidohydrolase family protein [Planctomycetaceae bacterium]|jgi:N-acetylglucosamine-6-phosphate deacetylase